jgi:hypothetical protein
MRAMIPGCVPASDTAYADSSFTTPGCFRFTTAAEIHEREPWRAPSRMTAGGEQVHRKGAAEEQPKEAHGPEQLREYLHCWTLPGGRLAPNRLVHCSLGMRLRMTSGPPQGKPRDDAAASSPDAAGPDRKCLTGGPGRA